MKIDIHIHIYVRVCIKVLKQKINKRNIMGKLKLICLFFLTKNWSIYLRTVHILLGYTTCFSALRVKFATNVLSGTRPEERWRPNDRFCIPT